jgi:hypothetical protein
LIFRACAAARGRGRDRRTALASPAFIQKHRLKRPEHLLGVKLIQSNVSVTQWSDWFAAFTDKRAPERFAVRFDRAQMSIDDRWGHPGAWCGPRERHDCGQPSGRRQAQAVVWHGNGDPRDLDPCPRRKPHKNAHSDFNRGSLLRSAQPPARRSGTTVACGLEAGHHGFGSDVPCSLCAGKGGGGRRAAGDTEQSEYGAALLALNSASSHRKSVPCRQPPWPHTDTQTYALERKPISGGLRPGLLRFGMPGAQLLAQLADRSGLFAPDVAVAAYLFGQRQPLHRQGVRGR